MKKIILTFILIIFTYILIGNVIAKGDIIPEDAIRIRVIANSNSEYDQKIKNSVRKNLEEEMADILAGIKNIDEARNKIKNNISKIEDNVEETLQNEECKTPFLVNFGLNYFPSKEFKGINYKEGYYESLVVTLGEGLGDNWWCVLFPPLCTLEAEEYTDVEYTTLAKTIIDKYF